MVRYTGDRTTRKSAVKKYSDGSSRRLYAVYDGRELLGTFVLNGATGVALAWDPERAFIGRFAGFTAAARGIGKTHGKKAAAAEARRRLSEPVSFASGLPAHFLGRPE